MEQRLNLSAYTVNVLGDASGSAAGTSSGTFSGDLRYCLSQAIADEQTDTITFDPSVFTNAADLTITRSTALANTSNPYGTTAFVVSSGDDITIDGAAVPGLTIDGGDAKRLFAVAGGGTLNLENLTLSGGMAQGCRRSWRPWVRLRRRWGRAGWRRADRQQHVHRQWLHLHQQPSHRRGGRNRRNYLVWCGRGRRNGWTGCRQRHFLHGRHGRWRKRRSGGHYRASSGGRVAWAAVAVGLAHAPNVFPGGKGGFGGGGGGGGVLAGAGGSGSFGGGGGAAAWAITQLRWPAAASAAARVPRSAAAVAAQVWGGHFSTSGTLTLTNDTFASNTATGGAPRRAADPRGWPRGWRRRLRGRNGSLTATFDTFSSNTVNNGDTTAGTASDLYVLSDGSGNQATATITNSILGQNGATTVSDFYAGILAPGTAPNLGSSTNNLVSDNPASPNGLTGTITGTNPNFATGMLAFNGGPTNTIALSSASTAALGQATTTTGITVDQRGVHRNAATPDVGAFEFTPPPATTYTVTVATDNSGSSAGSGSGTSGEFRYCINQAILDDGSADTIDFVIPHSTIALAPPFPPARCS